MDLEVAQQRLLDAIDALHPNLGIDALRLADAIDELIEARLRLAASASPEPSNG
jgi:hypothetical protein